MWAFCKHKGRNCSHREDNETIIETTEREIYEETGAVEYELTAICVYSVIGKNKVNKTDE